MSKKRKRAYKAAFVVCLAVLVPMPALALDWARFSSTACYETSTDWQYLHSLRYNDSSSYARTLYCPVPSGNVALGYEGTTMDRVHVHIQDGHSSGSVKARLIGQSPWSSSTWDTCDWGQSGYQTVGNETIVLDSGGENCISNSGYFVTLEVEAPIKTYYAPSGLLGYAVGF